MLHDLLIHLTMSITLVPWGTAIVESSTLVPSHKINTDNLSTYRSPKVTNIDSYNMCVFGIRINANDQMFSTGNWLTHPAIKEALTFHNVAVTISNSTCDSGNTVTAGTILLKYPKYTHCRYFLMSIRRRISTLVSTGEQSTE